MTDQCIDNLAASAAALAARWRQLREQTRDFIAGLASLRQTIDGMPRVGLLVAAAEGIGDELVLLAAAQVDASEASLNTAEQIRSRVLAAQADAGSVN